MEMRLRKRMRGLWIKRVRERARARVKEGERQME